MIRGKTDNKPFTIHPQETRPSEVRSDALLGCPFCGTTDVQMKTSKVVFWVQCNNTECFCSMGGERTEKDAVKAWNTRQSNDLSEGSDG